MTQEVSTGSPTGAISRRRRRRISAKVVAGLAVASLALPAAASAYPVPEPASSAANAAAQPSGHQVSRSLTPAELAIQPGSQSGQSASDDGFAWGDAAIGAGAILGLFALAGAAGITVRRHGGTVPTRSAPSSS